MYYLVLFYRDDVSLSLRNFFVDMPVGTMYVFNVDTPVSCRRGKWSHNFFITISTLMNPTFVRQKLHSPNLTKYGALPLPSKFASILDFPRPVTVMSLQKFLGMMNFYHRFIPKSAALHVPPAGGLEWESTRTPAVPWRETLHSQIIRLLWPTQRCWHTHHLTYLLPSP